MRQSNDMVFGTFNFKYGEFTKSSTALRKGIDNTPSDKHWESIEDLASNVLQALRDEFGPIRITSGYRSEELCIAVGSSKNSNHARGQAADIEPYDSSIKLISILEYIVENLEFRTVIAEYFPDGWIHVDFRTGGNVKRIKLKDANHNYENVSLDYIKQIYN